MSALNANRDQSVQGRQTAASSTNGSVWFDFVPTLGGAYRVTVSGSSTEMGTLTFSLPVYECTFVCLWRAVRCETCG